MDTKDQLALFEKMHHHELDIKEKLTTRAQIIFTLILAVMATSSYIVRMLDFSEHPNIAWAIVSLIIAYLFFIGISCFFAIRVFWGNKFGISPSAGEIGTYCKDLNDYNISVRAWTASGGEGQNEVNLAQEMDTFLSDAYKEAATHNFEVNKSRAGWAHLSFRFLLLSFAPLVVSGGLFVSFDMDTSSPRKNYQVIDKYVGDQLGIVERQLKIISSNTLEIGRVLMSKENESTSDTVQNQLKEVQPTQNTAALPLTAAPKRPERPQVQFVMNMERAPKKLEELAESFRNKVERNTDDDTKK
ncbi:hypothetical protein NPS53_24345 [Pseudomonas putida]|uniref:hypothetical protein n=1 Tax=Pseudomonas putida TaxID=303 RepID=UPI0023632D5B|nr:hypothetical protein [Pseudomonas putida]MDD2142710.1 hypothetical protein [Pseudomonas putida]HDS1724479.1 hypothetical protein [Pseudomonas putida]